MKYKGTIEIKDGFSLTNPTMESQGIKDALDGEDNILFKYLEVYFQEPNQRIIHSRYWEISDESEQDFINNNNVLNKFK